MKMDAHPPNKIRVNQAFRNFKPFSEIWECPAGSPMNPKDRCQIWWLFPIFPFYLLTHLSIFCTYFSFSRNFRSNLPAADSFSWLSLLTIIWPGPQANLKLFLTPVHWGRRPCPFSCIFDLPPYSGGSVQTLCVQWYYVFMSNGGGSLNFFITS